MDSTELSCKRQRGSPLSKGRLRKGRGTQVGGLYALPKGRSRFELTTAGVNFNNGNYIVRGADPFEKSYGGGLKMADVKTSLT